MRKTFEELAAILSAEARELRELSPLIEEEARALVRADVPGVLEALRRQEPAAIELAKLEGRRRALLALLARALGVAEESLTLSALLERFPQPSAGLVQLRQDLRELLETLLALNTKNRFLAERSLGYVTQLLNQLVRVMDLAPEPTYAATGRTGQAVTAAPRLDRQA